MTLRKGKFRYRLPKHVDQVRDASVCPAAGGGHMGMYQVTLENMNEMKEKEGNRVGVPMCFAVDGPGLSIIVHPAPKCQMACKVIGVVYVEM